MKLKDTKYLLPTTEGRLHKELSYLISLHENKMTKGKIKNRLDDLENKVNEMSHALSMMYNSIESSEQLFEKDDTPQFKKFNEGDTIVCKKEKSDMYFLNDEFKVLEKGWVKLKNGNFTMPTSEYFELIIKQIEEPITSTTLKTPNEWLKLMSDEEVNNWNYVRKLENKTYITDEKITFNRFISTSFTWEKTTQGKPYWQNISNRYNN